MSETVTRFPRRWAQSEQVGELTTTFTGDFNIAEDISGLKGVRSTFATAFNEWKDDVRYMANLAIVTNMKCRKRLCKTVLLQSFPRMLDALGGAPYAFEAD